MAKQPKRPADPDSDLRETVSMQAEIIRAQTARLDAYEATLATTDKRLDAMTQRMDGAKLAQVYTPMRLDDAKAAVRASPTGSFVVASPLLHPVALEQGRTLRPQDFGGAERVVQYLDAGLKLAAVTH